MLRASLLTLIISSTSMALLGDWKVWTPTLQPRMAVVRDDIAWIATSSGVVEWDLRARSSRVHTRLDGLPTMDYAAVVLDSQKTLWAIGADGRIGYQTKGSSSWKTATSYSSQNWVFSPRAAQYWKGYLIFGTDRGLSLYSTSSKTAEDYAKTFGSLSGTVRSVMVTPGLLRDTLWVGLDHGIAYATPHWDSIGKPGHFLADPSKWMIKTTLDNPNADLILVRDANGVRASSWQAEWSDATGGIAILDTNQVKWNGQSQVVPGAIHAAPAGSNVVVSTSARGSYLVGPSGILQKAEPEGDFPDYSPVNARFKSDGTPYVLSSSDWTHRVLSYSSNASLWIPDSIRYETATGTQEAHWHNFENMNRHRQSLALGPNEEIVVPSWGDHATQGGLYTSKPSGGWNHFAITPTDTCLTYALDSVDYPTTKPENYLTYGSALTSARSFPSGTWMSALGSGNANPSRILFLAPGGQTAPTCFDVPRENPAAEKEKVNDFLPSGDTLWLGSSAGLIRVPAPRPSYPPPLVVAAYIKPSDKNTLEIFRLARTTFMGMDWIVGAAKGRLTLYPTHGGWGTPVRTDLITSESSAPTLKQDYYALAVDAQGQIWAGGKDGIDIVQLVEPEFDSLPPSFFHVQRITTAEGLLDNDIYDFDLEVSTGKALIVSPHGVALWSSPFRPLTTKLAKAAVRVYPNPVRLRDHRGSPADKVLIVDGATVGSRLDLLAADGTLVMHLDETKQVGGRFQVELPAASKLRPGLYFWSLKDKKGSVRGPLLIAE